MFQSILNKTPCSSGIQSKPRWASLKSSTISFLRERQSVCVCVCVCVCLVNSVPSSRTPCCLPQLKESIFKEADSSNTITWRDQVLRAKQPGRCSTSASIQLTPIWHNIAMFVVAQGCRPILLVCHDWSITMVIRTSYLKVYQWFLAWQTEFLVINVEKSHLVFLWKLTYPPPKKIIIW